jgi:proteasome lid subunit RPN8/RPN11
MMRSSYLKASPEHLQQIRLHAERTYPEECCGLLLGTIAHEGKTLLEVWATDNSWDGEDTEFLVNPSLSRCNRFSIAPEDLLKAQKNARDRNLAIIGVYHSHPDHPAMPSERDRAIAWAEYSYLIVSVQQGRAQALGSWMLDDEGQFQAQDIILPDSCRQSNPAMRYPFLERATKTKRS